MAHITATYSPDDNKLRLYASTRLDAETYARVRAAGYIWAPKQALFVAPMWTPEREDLALELAGEIGDEDTSLTERAETRADRFDTYGEKRAADSNAAHAAVSRIADGVPLGQPILVGHHSERHARKDAERIENGMRRAVKMWETSKYWVSRAAGALAHAAHKERPDVRARRIKTLTSDRRKVEKDLARSRAMLTLWRDPLAHMKPKNSNTAPTLRGCVLWLLEVETYALYDIRRAVEEGTRTPEDAQAARIQAHEKYTAEGSPANRWLAHYDNRLAYEKALLGETDYIQPPKAPTRAALPILNYSGPVTYANRWREGETVTTEAHGMTSAEYAQINKDYKGTFISADGTHRIRSAVIKGHSLCAVWLTDKKQHPKPGAGADTPEQAEVDRRARDGTRALAEQRAKSRAVAAHNREVVRTHGQPPEPAAPTEAPATLDRDTVDAMRATLKAGVSVVAVPQLFPTPRALAARMAELLDAQPGHRVLEPSAGTGALLAEIPVADVVCVELNHGLAEALRCVVVDVRCGDFLTMNGELGTFDRIIMNPPFSHGADLKHIAHARTHLKPGGRIVALCANGPRQQAAFADDAQAVYEPLPAGTFSEAGTNVNVALVVIDT